MKDLDHLIAKVEAGGVTELHFNAAAQVVGGEIYQWRKTAYEAYAGSLDAAKRLHEAVLPGWEWRLRDAGRAWVWRTLTDQKYSDGDTDITARAWLLAILRALKGAKHD